MIDLYGGSVSLWIENNGKMIPARDLFGKGLDYINTVSVRIGLGEIFNIEIELDPPLDEAINIMSTGKIGIGFSVSKPSTKSTGENKSQVSLNKIAVQMSYGGITSPVFKGILTMPQLTINESGIAIKLQGVGMLFDATATSMGGKSIEGTRLDVIKKLLGDNVDVVVDSKDSKLKEGLGKPFVLQNITKTNFETAKEICAEAKCDIVYEGAKNPSKRQKVKIISKDMQRSTKGPLFVAFKQINPNAGVFPILSLDSPMTNLTLPGAAFGAKVPIFNKSTGESVEDSAGKDSYAKVTDKITSADGSVAGGGEQSRAGEDGDAALSRADEQGGILGMISRTGSDGADAIKNIVHSYMEKTFNYNLTSVGVFNLLPGRVIGVNVADIKALSGEYDLAVVTHTLSASGAETSMEVMRMGGYVAGIGNALNDTVSKVVNSDSVKRSIPIR